MQGQLPSAVRPGVGLQSLPMPLDVQTWWNQSNSTRIPAIILGVILIALRIYLTIKDSKNRRSPRVRRMERSIAIALWTLIALAVLVLFLTGRFR
jgi:small-conductance mechanosensitive channel